MMPRQTLEYNIKRVRGIYLSLQLHEQQFQMEHEQTPSGFSVWHSEECVHMLADTLVTASNYNSAMKITSLTSSTAQYAFVGRPSSFGCTSIITNTGFGT